jgi:hypothetical protein
LEHKDIPEVVLPVAVAFLVFFPLMADGGGVEVAFSFQAAFVEEGFGPVF